MPTAGSIIVAMPYRNLRTALRRADRINYEEIAKDLREHYQTTGSRNLEEAEYRLKHLDSLFAGQRIAAINPARITAYVAKRQEEGAANATINRELETLPLS
jgi:capsid protein